MSSVQARIEQKLQSAFVPAMLQVVNESHMHSVPPGSETHFKVVVVSDRFAGKRPVEFRIVGNRNGRRCQAVVIERGQKPVRFLAILVLPEARG